jgi:hypothetical protein
MKVNKDIKKNSPETLYEQRFRLGLFYKCGDKFMPSHQCLVKGLNMIEGNKNVKEGSLYDEVKNVIEDTIENRKVEEFGLSLNALADIYAYNTIRIRGSY